MNNFKYKLQNFFRNKYGIDSLTIFLFVVSVVFINISYMRLAGFILQMYCVFRAFSTNIYKRQKELQWFNKNTLFFKNLYLKAINKYKKLKLRNAQKKDYVFIKCRNCKNILRLPKNKGKLHVTCPVCKAEYLKKT